MKMIDEDGSGRCLVFSFELAQDGVVIASQDSSSECPISKSTELAVSKPSRI